MSGWIRKVGNPLGTLPKGLINKVGIIGGAVVMALVIITSPSSDEEGEAAAGGEAPAAEGAEEQAATGEPLVSSTSSAIQRLRQQAERLQQAQAREEERRRQAAAAAGALRGRDGSGRGALPGLEVGGSGTPDTPESQLREELRLAEIRRAHEALRSPVVAFSLRREPDPAAVETAASEEPAEATGPAPEASAAPPSVELAELKELAAGPGGVGDWQQARLAVSFHRLVFPDGRYVRLEFGALDQSGATGLQDRVNRHYLSTIGAAGAVGVISGLTLRGSQPYAGGIDGARAGAGIGMGRAAESILDRYLNRLPTVTIRAGQRLRIIFTSDALVPRPAFRLQPSSRRDP